MSRGPARPSRPAGRVAIGGSSAARSRSPRPRPGRRAPLLPPLARLERLLLLGALPLPFSAFLLPRAPLCVRGLPRGTEGRPERALSVPETWTRTRRQVRCGGRGSGPLPVRPNLSTVLLSDSFPTLRTPLCALPRGPWPRVPGPSGRSSGAPPGGPSWAWGAPPLLSLGPVCAPLCRHLSPPALSPSRPKASAAPQHPEP